MPAAPGEWDEAGCVDRETWLKAGREGLLCVTVPDGIRRRRRRFRPRGDRRGGSASRRRARASLFACTRTSSRPYIARLGTEEQKQNWLPEICPGETILAIAMTEPGTGSDLKAIRTTAVRDGDEYVINGSKTFISNGLNCRHGDGGLQDRSVGRREGREPDHGRDRPRGVPPRPQARQGGHAAADTAELFFDNVRVPGEQPCSVKRTGASST